MEKSDSVQRAMYIPMEALPRDIVSRYGNVRVLVVPKERSASTSSCKENEDCFSKDGNVFEDDSDWTISESKSRSTPVSPDFTYRQRQVFEYRTPNIDPERFTQELQDVEILKSKAELTPKRIPEVVRYEKADDSVVSTPHKKPDQDRKTGDSVSENIKRKLFEGIENEYRFMRNDTYHRRQPASHEDLYPERMREAEKPVYYSYLDKRSPGPDHTRVFFDRDFSYHDRHLPSPSWTTHAPPSPFHDHHRCDCMERQHRHVDSNRDRVEMAKKRKISDISSTENIVPLSPRVKKQKCTCSMMETNFLQMAEAAYKNIRRRDTTPASFEQFRKELVETNSVLKESVSILSTIREICEHKSIRA